jgi:hypothetical protein
LDQAQQREIGELVKQAPGAGVSLVLLVRRSSLPGSHFSGAQVIALPNQGEALKGLMEAWVSDATSGQCKLTVEAARLLVDISLGQGTSWVNLARGSVVAARAAGQFVIPSWAVLRAGALPQLSDVLDVPAEFRSRPRCWPTRDVAQRLGQINARWKHRGTDMAEAEILSFCGTKEAAAAHLA